MQRAPDGRNEALAPMCIHSGIAARDEKAGGRCLPNALREARPDAEDAFALDGAARH